MLIIVMGTLFVLSIIMVNSSFALMKRPMNLLGPQIGIAWLVGARFDLAFSELKDGNWRSLGKDNARKMAAKYDRGEL